MGEYWAAESGEEERSCGDDLLIGSMVASAVGHVRCKNLGRYGERERGERRLLEREHGGGHWPLRCWRGFLPPCSIIVVGESEKLVVCLRIS